MKFCIETGGNQDHSSLELEVQLIFHYMLFMLLTSVMFVGLDQ